MPLTAVILYVFELPEQTVAVPLIVPGAAGTEPPIVTFNVCAKDDPQELFAVTEIVPLVELAVVMIEFVVEEPLQPEGNVHV